MPRIENFHPPLLTPEDQVNGNLFRRTSLMRKSPRHPRMEYNSLLLQSAYEAYNVTQFNPPDDYEMFEVMFNTYRYLELLAEKVPVVDGMAILLDDDSEHEFTLDYYKQDPHTTAYCARSSNYIMRLEHDNSKSRSNGEWAGRLYCGGGFEDDISLVPWLFFYDGNIMPQEVSEFHALGVLKAKSPTQLKPAQVNSVLLSSVFAEILGPDYVNFFHGTI